MGLRERERGLVGECDMVELGGELMPAKETEEDLEVDDKVVVPVEGSSCEADPWVWSADSLVLGD